MTGLPAEYYARCTDTGCSWARTTPDRDYRDQLAKQHENRYHGHVVSTTDYE